jgi:hypothetical protein
MEEAMSKRIAVTKEHIQVQEENLSLSMSAEDAVDKTASRFWRRNSSL